MKFLLLSAVLYAPGTLLYLQIRREQNKPLFAATEWFVFVAVLAGSVLGVYGLASGYLVI